MGFQHKTVPLAAAISTFMSLLYTPAHDMNDV